MIQEAPRLVSVQVGRPRAMNYEGTAWTSAIGKVPVQERLFLDRTNLASDRQANRKYHGGPEKAVCCFAAEHYPVWRAELGLDDSFAYGAFGENFTLLGMLENQVCIGDIYTVGTARVQVASPRRPCINLARRWDRPELPRKLTDRGHTGYYLRVLQTGEVGAGETPALLERPQPEITISLLNEAHYRKAGGQELAQRLAALPELSRDWRWNFQRRLSTR
jgi:MOSC domain-containing protein YiiM